MKTFSILLQNHQYKSLPQEDHFKITKNIFSVADGITRDPETSIYWKDKSREELIKDYPQKSGAYLAAKFFCSSFNKYLSNKEINQKNLRSAFIFANNQIKNLNKRYIPVPDYLVNDFYACVASGGVIKDGFLYWGAITDCGIIVYDKKGKTKFQTPDYMEPFAKYISKHKGYWNDPKRRVFIRSIFRNNSKQIKNGKLVSYGALTGEKQAEFFMHFGKVRLEKDDVIIFHTDGFTPIINNENFQTILSKDFMGIKSKISSLTSKLISQDIEKYGKEKTLVAIKL